MTRATFAKACSSAFLAFASFFSSFFSSKVQKEMLNFVVSKTQEQWPENYGSNTNRETLDWLLILKFIGGGGWDPHNERGDPQAE